jgi:hypothetical protein
MAALARRLGAAADMDVELRAALAAGSRTPRSVLTTWRASAERDGMRGGEGPQKKSDTRLGPASPLAPAARSAEAA